jgi:hypothetical protein
MASIKRKVTEFLLQDCWSKTPMEIVVSIIGRVVQTPDRIATEANRT